MNEKNKDENYPFLGAIDLDNIKIIQLLKEYWNKHQFVLELYEKN